MSTPVHFYGMPALPMCPPQHVPVNTVRFDPVLVGAYPMCFFVPSPAQPMSPTMANEGANVDDIAAAEPTSTRAVSETRHMPTLLGHELSKPSIVGKVWILSQCQAGCRDVQHAVEMAQSDDECAAIADELRGHVWDAVCSPHANYVLQKCIVKMRPKTSQFIIDELLQKRRVGQAARHKYGCRVLQRVLEHCRADQVKPIVDELLADAMMLCRHAYASYVMQHVFEQGSDTHVQTLMRVIIANAATFGSDSFACAVVYKALVLGEFQDRVELATALLHERGLVVRMARSRRGHLAVKLMLELFEKNSPEWFDLRAQLRGAESSLRTARYGRTVFGLLDVSSGSDGIDASCQISEA